jgi:phosphoglycerate dehydrogenase-like enzyme
MPSPVNVLVLSKPGSHLNELASLNGAANFTVTDDPDRAAAAAPGAEVILNGFFTGTLLKAAFPAARSVRWVHTLSAGIDRVLFPELVHSPVVLTNGRGVFRRPLGEFVLAASMYFAKDLRRLVHNQQTGVWQQFNIEELYGRTMGIIGFGEIGRVIAELAKAVGMRVIAIRRHPELSGKDPLLDAVYAPAALHDLLRESDYVAVTAPNTPETRGMIAAREFDAMKPTAVIVNVGRGPVISEPALIRALEQGQIRGAALDVFDEEPLPPGHPFWRLPNLLLSPHSADHTAGWLERAVSMFVRNFGHFVKGEPLENVVDKRAGY